MSQLSITKRLLIIKNISDTTSSQKTNDTSLFPASRMVACISIPFKGAVIDLSEKKEPLPSGPVVHRSSIMSPCRDPEVKLIRNPINFKLVKFFASIQTIISLVKIKKR